MLKKIEFAPLFKSVADDYINWRILLKAFPGGSASWDDLVERAINVRCDTIYDRRVWLDELGVLVSVLPYYTVPLDWDERSMLAKDKLLATYCPADVPGSTWDNRRLLLYGDNAAIASMGRTCPADVEGTAWDVRVNAQVYVGHLVELGWQCPAEVEGSTWENRLRLQESRADRSLLGRYCPANVKGATWKVRLALQRNDLDRQWLGYECPAGVKGATWEARLALSTYPEAKAKLGCYCPADVEGATWEVRLAQQRTDRERNTLGLYCPLGTPGATYEARCEAFGSGEIPEDYILMWKCWDKYQEEINENHGKGTQ